MLVRILKSYSIRYDENSFEIRTEKDTFMCKINYGKWLIHIEIQKITCLLIELAILLMYARLS